MCWKAEYIITIQKVFNHFTLIKTIIIKKKKQNTVSIDKDMEKLEPLGITGGNVKCSYYGKQYKKLKNRIIHIIQQFHFWVSTQKNWRQVLVCNSL